MNTQHRGSVFEKEEGESNNRVRRITDNDHGTIKMGAAPGVENAAALERFHDAREVLENDPDLCLPSHARGDKLGATLMSKAAVARKTSMRNRTAISPKRSKRIKRFESKRKEEEDDAPTSGIVVTGKKSPTTRSKIKSKFSKKASSRYKHISTDEVDTSKGTKDLLRTSPTVRRASLSSAARKSFREKEATSNSKVDSSDSSDSDEEDALPAKPKMPHHLKTPASMKKGFFGRRGSLEDFSKQLALFKTESAVFRESRVQQARASLNKSAFKRQNLETRMSSAVDAFENMRKKAHEAGEDNSAKGKWKKVAARITHKQAVERTKNRLRKMNSFWDKEASKWQIFEEEDTSDGDSSSECEV